MQVEEEERCEIGGYEQLVCVLKFDSPLPEDHRAGSSVPSNLSL
jgi:hypothetical protein